MQLPDENLQYIYQCFLIVLAAFTICGYGVYGVAIWNNKELQKKTIWITSLAVADLMIVIDLVIASFSLFNHSLGFRDTSCHVNAVISLFFGYAQIASMTWTAVDKYYQVCEPEKFGLNYGFYIVGVWLLSFIVAALPLLGFGAFEDMTDDSISCLLDLNNTKNRFYVILVALLFFAIPLYQMITCYSKVVHKSEQFKQLAKWVIVVFIAFYTPYAMHAGLKVTVGVGSLPMWFLAFINILPKCISASNPYIYMHTDPDLLQACRDVVLPGRASQERKEE